VQQVARLVARQIQHTANRSNGNRALVR